MAKSTIADIINRLENDELVTIIVGQEGSTPPPKEYRIQRTLLINSSEWFDKALNNDWAEGRERKLRFPDTDPQVVELFLYYLISGVLPFDTNNLKGIPGLEDGTLACQRLAVRLWVFGDEHFLPKLQNNAMCHLYRSFDKYGKNPELEAMREGFDNCGSDSTLFGWLVVQLVMGLEDRVKYKNSVARDPTQRMANPPGYDMLGLKLLEGCQGLVTQLAVAVVRKMENPNFVYGLKAMNRYLVPESNCQARPEPTDQSAEGGKV